MIRKMSGIYKDVLISMMDGLDIFLFSTGFQEDFRKGLKYPQNFDFNKNHGISS